MSIKIVDFEWDEHVVCLVLINAVCRNSIAESNANKNIGHIQQAHPHLDLEILG